MSSNGLHGLPGRSDFPATGADPVRPGAAPRDWRRGVIHALLTQSLLVCTAAGIAVLFDSATALAVLLGGAISWLPNAWFAARAIWMPAGIDAEARLRHMVVAEVVKLLLSALLFALVFSRLPTAPPAIVLLSFVAAHINYLVMLVAFQRGRDGI